MQSAYNNITSIILPNLSPITDNFEKIIDYRDKKFCTDNGNPTVVYLINIQRPNSWSTFFPSDCV